MNDRNGRGVFVCGHQIVVCYLFVLSLLWSVQSSLSIPSAVCPCVYRWGGAHRWHPAACLLLLLTVIAHAVMQHKWDVMVWSELSNSFTVQLNRTSNYFEGIEWEAERKCANEWMSPKILILITVAFIFPLHYIIHMVKKEHVRGVRVSISLLVAEITGCIWRNWLST